MKKFLIQIVALVIVISGAFYFYISGQGLPFNIVPQQSSSTTTQGKKTLAINEAKIKVEVADTQTKRSMGLGGRDSLPSGEGMYFVFPKEDKYSFWMKGLKFPLDIIWIKGDKIVDILTNIQPPEAAQKDETLPIFQPVVPIDRVLEVNAGTVGELQLKVGDTVKLID